LDLVTQIESSASLTVSIVDVSESEKYGAEWNDTGTSLLDGLILYWFSHLLDSHCTAIYLADTHQQAQDKGPIVISKVAELDYAADRAVLVGNGDFATAEWLER